jgi:hypothetical protein
LSGRNALSLGVLCRGHVYESEATDGYQYRALKMPTHEVPP